MMIVTASHEHLFQLLLDRARTRMSERRLLHVIGVTHVMGVLAEIHNLSRDAAILAALVHDQSKELAPDNIEQDLHRMGEPLADVDRDFPRVWHGLHAAAWARHELGIRDDEVLEATALHSTTDAEICALTKALYIADIVEPGRHNPSAWDLFDAARNDLDEGFRRALIYKTRFMIEQQHAKLHPRSLRALSAYVGVENMQALGLVPVTEPATP